MGSLFAGARYRLEFAEKSHDEVSPMGRTQEFVMTQADSPSQGEPRGMSRSSTRGMAAIDVNRLMWIIALPPKVSHIDSRIL